MGEITFRPVEPEESGLLDEMTLAGIRHWGHHEKFPDAYNGLANDLESHDIGASHVYVVEDDGEVVAFYEIVDRADHVELLRMFQVVERIGTGLGRLMWEHAVAEAAEVGDRMMIVSDPMASGFYEKMGAARERSFEPVPGFELGVYWFDLPSSP